MASQPIISLNDGNRMPQLGFGVWQVENSEATHVVRQAIETGYRSIDTAAIYRNEEGVGEALKGVSVPREELFVTTKLWNDRHGYDETFRAFDESLKKLQLDYVDLYLIHWPVARQDKFVEAWRAFAKLKEDGRARSIGVSNFTAANLRRLFDETGITPVLNQVELHPRFQQKDLRAFHAQHGIATESWSPLGRGTVMDAEALAAIGRKYGKSPAQVIIRWHLDSGLIVIPKSVTPERIRENFDVLDFQLDAQDMEQMARLDTDEAGRIGTHPDNFG
jgi:2,5-diketo-D-gluconate reductase A